MAKNNSKYHWERWFSKSRFDLEYGRHFECDPASMIQQVRNAASRYGVSVSIKFDVESSKIKVKVNA